MERWCPVVLLVLCSVVLTLSGVEADYNKFDNDCCTYFLRLDSNRDLNITIADFITIADKILTTNESVSVSKSQAKSLAKKAAKFFLFVNESLIEAILTDGVSLKGFVESMRERRNSTELKKAIKDLAKFAVRTFNSDGDNTTLTPHELSTVYTSFGIPRSTFTAEFEHLDKNGDGLISVDEYYEDGEEYFNEAVDQLNNWAGAPLFTCEAVSMYDPSNLPPP